MGDVVGDGGREAIAAPVGACAGARATCYKHVTNKSADTPYNTDGEESCVFGSQNGRRDR